MTKKPKEKYKYCFPNAMAKFMKKVDDRTQMEASLMSMFLLLIGIILFTIYIAAFTDFSWWFRGFTIFNSFCGFLFISSYLVTTFQQYQVLMETQEVIGQIGTDEPFEIKKPKPIKENNSKTDLNELKGGLKKENE